MQKVFILMDWMMAQNMMNRTRLKFMTQMLGYELEDSLFDLLAS
jgi:hypothetical protein